MTTWRKSTFSGNGGADCVELADLGNNIISVRDSKLGEDSPVLRLTREQVAGLVESIKAGSYDDLI